VEVNVKRLVEPCEPRHGVLALGSCSVFSGFGFPF